MTTNPNLKHPHRNSQVPPPLSKIYSIESKMAKKSALSNKSKE